MPTAPRSTRSILLKLQDGSLMQVDEIPATAKITLGPVSPGKADYNNRDIALRIYTTAGNQLAVFRNVVSFRDLTLKVKMQKIRKETSTTDVQGPMGKLVTQAFVQANEWVDDNYEIDVDEEFNV